MWLHSCRLRCKVDARSACSYRGRTRVPDRETSPASPDPSPRSECGGERPRSRPGRRPGTPGSRCTERHRSRTRNDSSAPSSRPLHRHKRLRQSLTAPDRIRVCYVQIRVADPDTIGHTQPLRGVAVSRRQEKAILAEPLGYKGSHHDRPDRAGNADACPVFNAAGRGRRWMDPQLRLILDLVQKSVVLCRRLSMLSDLAGEQIEFIRGWGGGLLPGRPGREAGSRQRLRIHLDLPTRCAEDDFAISFFDGNFEISFVFDILQFSPEGRQLLPQVVLLVFVLEELPQAQPLPELLVDPQRRASFALRLDHRLPQE